MIVALTMNRTNSKSFVDFLYSNFQKKDILIKVFITSASVKIFIVENFICKIHSMNIDIFWQLIYRISFIISARHVCTHTIFLSLFTIILFTREKKKKSRRKYFLLMLCCHGDSKNTIKGAKWRRMWVWKTFVSNFDDSILIIDLFSYFRGYLEW